MQLNESQKIKWQKLVKPMLIATITVIVVYSFLHWLIVIKWDVEFNENWVMGYIPIIISLIVVWIWIWPGIRIVRLPSKKGGLPALYFLVAAAIIAGPMIIAQLYLSIATGKLSLLFNVNQVERSEKTKYYRFVNLYVDKKNVADYEERTTGGRRNRNLYFKLYRAVPMYAKAADTSEGACSYWMIFEYQENHKNNLSEDVENASFNQFLQKSYNDFERKNLYAFSYLERAGLDGRLEERNLAVRTSELIKHIDPVLFIPRQGEYANRNGHRLGWLIATLIFGPLLWILMVASPKIDYEKLEKSEEATIKKAGAHRRKPPKPKQPG